MFLAIRNLLCALPSLQSMFIRSYPETGRIWEVRLNWISFQQVEGLHDRTAKSAEKAAAVVRRTIGKIAGSAARDGLHVSRSSGMLSARP